MTTKAEPEFRDFKEISTEKIHRVYGHTVYEERKKPGELNHRIVIKTQKNRYRVVTIYGRNTRVAVGNEKSWDDLKHGYPSVAANMGDPLIIEY